MDRMTICQEWEKEFMHEVIPSYHWAILFDRLAGSPHTPDPHHEMCLVSLGPSSSCTHCTELFGKEKLTPKSK